MQSMHNYFQARPDSPWSYVVLVSAMLNHFVLFGTSMSFSVFLNVLMKHFGTTRGTTAWFNSIQSAVFYFSGPLVSILLKRYNWRILIVSGSLLNGIGLALSYFATSIYYLYITIGLIVGFAYGLMHVPSVVAVGAYFTRTSQRSMAQALSLAGGSLGTLLLPPLVYKLILKFGFRGAFLTLGGLMFQTVVFSCLFLPFPPQNLTRLANNSQEFTPPSGRSDGKKKNWRFWRNNSNKNDKRNGPLNIITSSSKSSSLDSTNTKSVVSIDNELVDQTNVPSQVIDLIQNHDVDDQGPNFITVSPYPNTDIAPNVDMVPSPSILHKQTTTPSKLPKHIEHDITTTEDGIIGDDDVQNSNGSVYWRDPVFLLFVCLSALWTASIFIVMHLLFDFLIGDRKVKPALNAAWIFSVIMISGMVGNLIAGSCDTLYNWFKHHLSRRQRHREHQPNKRFVMEDSNNNNNLSSNDTSSCLSDDTNSPKTPNVDQQPTFNSFKCWVFNICTLLHGIATMLMLTTREYRGLCGTAIMFGLPYGVKVALGPTICVDLFGVQNLSFVYGYTMMACGIGILVSPPLGGFIVDITHNYVITFGMSALLSLASFLLFCILLIYKARRKNNGKSVYQNIGNNDHSTVQKLLPDTIA